MIPQREDPVATAGLAFVPAVIASEPASFSDVSDMDAAIVVELLKGGRLRIAASTPPALAAAVFKALR